MQLNFCFKRQLLWHHPKDYWPTNTAKEVWHRSALMCTVWIILMHGKTDFQVGIITIIIITTLEKKQEAVQSLNIKVS